MNCMNCGKDVDDESAAFVARVFLCEDCGAAGQQLKDKAMSGAENALATLDDSVRTALTNKSYPLTKGMIEKLEPAGALAFLLAVSKDPGAWNNPRPPSETTKLPATTVDGNGSSGSLKAVD